MCIPQRRSLCFHFKYLQYICGCIVYTIILAHTDRTTSQWRSQGGGGGGHGGHGPPKLLVVNFPINLRCYVLLGCRVINVILAINIGDSAFFDIAALVSSIRWFTASPADGIDRSSPPLLVSKKYIWLNCWLQTCTLWLHMGVHCHMTKSYKAVDTLAPPNQNPGYATATSYWKCLYWNVPCWGHQL